MGFVGLWGLPGVEPGQRLFGVVWVYRRRVEGFMALLGLIVRFVGFKVLGFRVC